MALVKCHECGADISDEVKKCIQCGAKNKSRKTSGFVKFLIFFFLIVFLVNIFDEVSTVSTNNNSMKLRAVIDQEKTGIKREEKDNNKAKLVNKGKWNSYTEVSAVDDSKNVYISLHSEKAIVSRFGQAIIPKLVLNCTENKTNVYINWQVYLGLGTTRMITRIDKKKAENITYDISTDTKAVFRRKPISFIKQLLKGDSLYAKITPYGENPVDIRFDIKGLDQHIGELRKACNW